MKKKVLSEGKIGDMTKTDLKIYIEEIVEDELRDPRNKTLKEEDVRKLVKEILKKFFRVLWANAPFNFDKI